MSGGSALESLEEDLKKAIDSTESLIKQLHDLQMPEPPSRPDELPAIVAAYNKSHKALSTELKSLKKLIEEYKDSQFTGISFNNKLLSVTTGTLSRIPLPGLPDPYENQESFLQLPGKYGADLLWHSISSNSRLRAHIELHWVPSKVKAAVNDRRDQDQVGHWLQIESEIAINLYRANPKLVNELLMDILKNLGEHFGPVKMSLEKWLEVTWDTFVIIVSNLGKEIAEIAKIIYEKVVAYFPEIAEFLDANAGNLTLFVGVVVIATFNQLAKRGYKNNANGDLEKNDST